jgi:uracil-DNA glycosylase
MRSSSRPESSAASEGLQRLTARLVHCRLCPRLVAYRTRVAAERVARFRDWTYWGRPVPGFGDPTARILVVGLAPAAHGGNRTGRIFTGDESGNWLYAALYRAGFANQATSTHRDDGLRLRDVWVTAAARCAPPANEPTRGELDTCRRWLLAELALLARVRVAVALGRVAHQAVLSAEAARGHVVAKPRPSFAHGAEHRLSSGLLLLCSYHPSQQNTFTGRLTRPMLDDVFRRAAALAGGSEARAASSRAGRRVLTRTGPS